MTLPSPSDVLPHRPPFLLVDGQRLPIRGLPLPHPVSTDLMLSFPEGPEVRIGAPLRATPPNCVRSARTDLAPSLTHSTHWWPTAAERMHSGQTGRPQRVQLT